MASQILFGKTSRPFATSFSGIRINRLCPIPNRPPVCGIRRFTPTCAVRATHYETLEVPPDATKGQIKASFYNLSKKYHPDVNPETKDKFVAAREAYSVLHDDRTRRAYDRSLSPDVGDHPVWSSDPAFPNRARAKHAWESRHHPRAHARTQQYSNAQRHTHTQQTSHSHTAGGYTHASPHARGATGGHGYSHLSREDLDSPHAKLRRDSGVWRVVQVFGVLWVVVSLTGITVHAGKA